MRTGYQPYCENTSSIRRRQPQEPPRLSQVHGTSPPSIAALRMTQYLHIGAVSPTMTCMPATGKNFPTSVRAWGSKSANHPRRLFATLTQTRSGRRSPMQGTPNRATCIRRSRSATWMAERGQRYISRNGVNVMAGLDASFYHLMLQCVRHRTYFLSHVVRTTEPAP
jgi:hypothetical protein